ncbi:MAG: hypothetical protein P1P90_06545 [Patescibacteria group bacterium]|nr:hypothetical protein [Patescibacteria group bacterium]
MLIKVKKHPRKRGVSYAGTALIREELVQRIFAVAQLDPGGGIKNLIAPK